MKLTSLLEMPKIIPALSIEDNLDLYSVNQAKYKELFTSNANVYKKFDNARVVYQSGKKFYCLDALRREVTYFMEYNVNSNKTLGSFLWQSLVWRSKKVEYNKTLPHEIFFDTLLPKYGVITTDGDQTDEGRRFWSYQVKFALDKNFFLYYHNLQTKELQQFKSMLEFDDLIKKFNIWGNSNLHRQKLIVISNKELI